MFSGGAQLALAGAPFFLSKHGLHLFNMCTATGPRGFAAL
ncbi:unannotated protein [freshwater metagenome]|uniref:Unannotated protein n=1 Tax=freshwater metagenome TaxID=449393 RepID=A0A6J7G5B6_9ZZZZ